MIKSQHEELMRGKTISSVTNKLNEDGTIDQLQLHFDDGSSVVFRDTCKDDALSQLSVEEVE